MACLEGMRAYQTFWAVGGDSFRANRAKSRSAARGGFVSEKPSAYDCHVGSPLKTASTQK